MSITALNTSSTSQLNYLGKLSAASSDSATGAARGHRPPPPPDGGGFIDAIASALQSIGVSDAGSTDSGATGTGTSSGGSTNAAQALGSFLQELMGALHEQGASAEAGGDGQSYGPPPGGGPGGPGGPGGGGGPGRLASDLQSLISKLGSDSGTTDETSETEDSTEDSATSPLQASFDQLLSALGSDTSDASGKLASFLQALSDKLPGAGSSGNLINTTV